MPGSAASNRPVTRDLVRWNDDIDKGLMLTMQYVCGEAGIKMPWKRIAEVMGPKFSEGSITQHLAKLRKRMAVEHIPVPPTLKRGYVAKTPSKVYSNANNTHYYEPVLPLYADTPKYEEDAVSLYAKAPMTPAGEWSDSPEPTSSKSAFRSATKANTKVLAKSAARSKGKGRKRGGAMSDEDEEDMAMPVLYDDSDEDYPAPPKKKAKTTRAKVEKTINPNKGFALLPATTSEPLIKTEDEEVVITEEPSPSGPARRTRGLKRNYTLLGDGDEYSNESEAETVIEGTARVDEAGQDSDEGGVGIEDNVEFGNGAQELAGPIGDFQANTIADFNMDSGLTAFDGNNLLNGNGLFNVGNMFNPGQNMSMWTMPDGTPVMMDNMNQPIIQRTYGDIFAPTPMDYFAQTADMPGMYDAAIAPSFAVRNDSVATGTTGVTMTSRNNSVIAGTTVAMPGAHLPTMDQTTIEDLIRAGNLEEDYQPDEFFSEALRFADQNN